MTNKKHTGSYYTPSKMADFIVKHISQSFRHKENITILEPSVGDGAFVIPLISNFENISMTVIDIDESELMKSVSTLNNSEIRNSYICKDFLFCDAVEEKLNPEYSLIIGNPPYIKKTLLSEEQLQKCREIHDSFNLSQRSINNIWTSFLLKSISLLAHDGVLAFVLPADLLQVKFAEELRILLKTVFERVEIFTFSNLLFECKGQDTIILFGYKTSTDPGLFFTNIEGTDFDDNIDLEPNLFMTDNEIKWNHHILSSDELEFLYSLKSQIRNVDHFCDSKPGIVTAANDFFIVDQKTERKYGLEDYTKPIIQRGLFINNSIVFREEDYLSLVSNGKPSKVICFNDNDDLSEAILDYLKIGKSLEIDTRYKCKKRKNWYVVPNISEPSEGFFFKRSHNYPKLIKNEAGVLVTDSGYKIAMKENYSINSFIYSFYNSLTLTFAEMEGRYYGGGVLELTPSEFKSLPLPLCNITDDSFEGFSYQFQEKHNIEEILHQHDATILELDQESLKRLQNIRKKLLHKRLR